MRSKVTINKDTANSREAGDNAEVRLARICAQLETDGIMFEVVDETFVYTIILLGH